MQIPAKGLYALEAVFELAEHYGGEPVRIADIARRRRIPQKFLELILATLKQAGLVDSRRGAEGGYILARPPAEVSVGDVLRAVEGSTGLRLAVPRDEQGPFTDLWRRLDQAVTSLLDATNFEELLAAWREKQSLAAPYWEI